MLSPVRILVGGVLLGVALGSQSADAAMKPTNPTLKATLVDAAKKAQEKAATVQVHVGGIKLVDPAKSHEQPKIGEGHLHYKLDDGPVIATTTTKLSFHELSSGKHNLVVMLAGNDHKPLGPQETLIIEVP